MGDLKGAPAVHFNIPLQSFSLYITFNSGIAASSEPIPSEYGRFGECLTQDWDRDLLDSLSQCSHYMGHRVWMWGLQSFGGTLIMRDAESAPLYSTL